MRWYASICQKLGENKTPFSNIKLLLSIGTATVQNLFQSCQEVNIHGRERKREREGKKIFFPAVCKVDTNASGRRLTTWHMSNKSKAWKKSQQFTVQESITGIKKYNPTNLSLKNMFIPKSVRNIYIRASISPLLPSGCSFLWISFFWTRGTLSPVLWKLRFAAL